MNQVPFHMIYPGLMSSTDLLQIGQACPNPGSLGTWRLAPQKRVALRSGAAWASCVKTSCSCSGEAKKSLALGCACLGGVADGMRALMGAKRPKKRPNAQRSCFEVIFGQNSYMQASVFNGIYVAFCVLLPGLLAVSDTHTP